jgi:hypothetical protein
MDYDIEGEDYPAIICGYILVAADFERLAHETPSIRKRIPSVNCCLNSSLTRGYDNWRRFLPRDIQMKIPKVRGTYGLSSVTDGHRLFMTISGSGIYNDKYAPAAPFLFAIRHLPYKSKKQLQSLHYDSEGFLKETEDDRTNLRRLIEEIKSQGGPTFEEESFTFGWTIDSNPWCTTISGDIHVLYHTCC